MNKTLIVRKQTVTDYMTILIHSLDFKNEIFIMSIRLCRLSEVLI